ncbi:hypothetical protein M569_09446, partial [Genlisea aurea]
MWRRISIQLRSLSLSRSTPRYVTPVTRNIIAPSLAGFSRYVSTESVASFTSIRVEDVMPIATGHEREELEAEIQGKNLLEINYPVGPFGTEEEPAVIKSHYNKRIVGCPGAEG